MEKEQLDIVKLIENNPITKLSNDYNVKLLTIFLSKFNIKFLSNFSGAKRTEANKPTALIPSKSNNDAANVYKL